MTEAPPLRHVSLRGATDRESRPVSLSQLTKVPAELAEGAGHGILRVLPPSVMTDNRAVTVALTSPFL